MTHNRLIALCQEYIAAVDAMRSGLYSTNELRTLDSERQLLHDELCRLTGYSRHVDMYRAARLILRDGGIDA